MKANGNVVQLHDKEHKELLEKFFLIFWDIYPRKVNKPLAKAKFMQIVTTGLVTKTFCKDSQSYVTIELEATPEEIIEGTMRFRASVIDPKRCRADDLKNLILKDDERWIPHPSTFLNRGGWMT